MSEAAPLPAPGSTAGAAADAAAAAAAEVAAAWRSPRARLRRARRVAVRRVRYELLSIPADHRAMIGHGRLPEGVEVRRGDGADLRALRELVPPYLARILARIEGPDGPHPGQSLFVATRTGRPVGCTLLSDGPLDLPHVAIRARPRPHERYSYGTYMLADERGSAAIARALFSAAAAQGRAEGATHLTCDVDVGNAKVNRTLKRVGTVAERSFSLVLAGRFRLTLRRRPA